MLLKLAADKAGWSKPLCGRQKRRASRSRHRAARVVRQRGGASGRGLGGQGTAPSSWSAWSARSIVARPSTPIRGGGADGRRHRLRSVGGALRQDHAEGMASSSSRTSTTIRCCACPRCRRLKCTSCPRRISRAASVSQPPRSSRRAGQCAFRRDRQAHPHLPINTAELAG